MKFKIRFADQIVGIFIIISLVSLVLVIVLLGKSQRWFAKDKFYTTILPSAAGLGKNMPVQYKGFAIGNVKTFYLTENDYVEVAFSINEEYCDRAKMGPMVEMMVSPIGLGNQFLFHSGRGDLLAENSFIPAVGSVQARELVRQGLAVEPYHDDSITLLMNRVSIAFDNLNRILGEVEEALGPGSDYTEIGKIVGSVQKTLAGAEGIPKSVDQAMAELVPALANINGILAQANDPNGTLFRIMDSDEAVYTNLVSSLGSVSSILDNLDKTTASQLPQIAGLIMELRTTIKSAEDVLVALANNPLLRKGVPERAESQSGGTSPRDIQF